MDILVELSFKVHRGFVTERAVDPVLLADFFYSSCEKSDSAHACNFYKIIKTSD